VKAARGVKLDVRAVSESMLIEISSRSAGRAFGARDGRSTNTQHRRIEDKTVNGTSSTAVRTLSCV
jgi:hypothetical protein